ncbi:MAG: 30S ribosomal protein S12 methylthiotransferase RimO [Firmicutes bacterium]|jgi:ribosomal protein S12 methylthiotransferase|nr:30S ribosomal protein S12 methylthiotransferase RimO [Bacillota bacterium]MDH7496486.1 30S ribosomal protein S12 methylthiotransferase RimO [Bacillota bacterium]
MGEVVALVSLGCAKNLVDSEVMAGLLSSAGYLLTSCPEDADVIVVNTCAFIDAAQQEAVDTILDLARYKKTGKCRALIVTGCLAQRFASEVLAEMPEVDAVVGTGDFPGIAGVVRQALAGQRIAKVGTPCYLHDENAPRILSTPPYMAYVKIAEGCSNRCSYCVIPELRGPYRSRPSESVVAEVRRLASHGVKELILIAQDTTRYGEDIYGRPSLAGLLREVCEVDGPRWVRVLYMYPSRVTDELIEVMASESKICKYVDLPLQHADDDILRSMNRKGTLESAREIIARLRQAMPDVTIRSTFMVGFPGETEEHFGRLLDFLREVRLDRVGVFAFSPQRGTPAARLRGRVPSRIKERRRREAMEVQAVISREKNEARVGRVFDVLIEGRSEESDLVTVGRSQAEAPEIDGLIYIGNEHPPPGEFRRVRIVDAGDHDLVGEILPTGAKDGGARKEGA